MTGWSELRHMRLHITFTMALLLTLAGCDEAATQRYDCEWQGRGQWDAYSTTAMATVSDGRLQSLRIVSTSGVIPDDARTCGYDLHGRSFEYVRDDDGLLQLRMLNNRGEGIGYLDYAIDDGTLRIMGIDHPDCETGRITFPIELRTDPSDCVVGPPMMR